ncbi:hypothetical protein I79_004678 [Cricetulus griseus]|uniref:Secreted protein n=1 Tax=Cricetulus griseus TaxID=10029 RepID=G3H366_CRIGR|nr:hypothetical protein I79_004678 [Cricetulus griseus]
MCCTKWAMWAPLCSIWLIGCCVGRRGQEVDSYPECGQCEEAWICACVYSLHSSSPPSWMGTFPPGMSAWGIHCGLDLSDRCEGPWDERQHCHCTHPMAVNFDLFGLGFWDGLVPDASWLPVGPHTRICSC